MTFSIFGVAKIMAFLCTALAVDIDTCSSESQPEVVHRSGGDYTGSSSRVALNKV
jgi:hypothetical protein